MFNHKQNHYWIVLIHLLIISQINSYAQEKLQVRTTKKIDHCRHRAEIGDTLHMQYTGRLKSTGEIFDSSETRGSPFIFQIGFRQVIQGWDQGLINICENEERKLIIPPSFAYGDQGASNVIPPGSTLLMDVKCDKIEINQMKSNEIN